jgi:two-component sensor histidine kinase
VFKHAFPNNESGELRIILKQKAADEVMLKIADDGVGLPSGFDPRGSDSVGLQTVFGIAQHQLQGKITCTTAKGVTWLLHFNGTLYQPRD